MSPHSKNGHSVVEGTKVVFIKDPPLKINMEELRLMDIFLPQLLEEMFQSGQATSALKENPQ
jgi:hypothetical protein